MKNFTLIFVLLTAVVVGGFAQVAHPGGGTYFSAVPSLSDEFPTNQFAPVASAQLTAPPSSGITVTPALIAGGTMLVAVVLAYWFERDKRRLMPAAGVPIDDEQMQYEKAADLVISLGKPTKSELLK